MNRSEQRILITQVPALGLSSVGLHAKGMFIGSISMIERRRHFEMRDHWYSVVHFFDPAGLYMNSKIQHTAGRRDDMLMLRTACQSELNQQIRELHMIEFKPIQVFPFHIRSDGLVFGVVEDVDDSDGNPVFVYRPNGIALSTDQRN